MAHVHKAHFTRHRFFIGSGRTCNTEAGANLALEILKIQACFYLNQLSKTEFIEYVLFLNYDFCFSAESRFGCGSSHHNLHTGEVYRLLQTLHEYGHQHPVSQAQLHQQRLLLLSEPHDSRYLGLYPPGVPRR